jgi:hypothetical protein
MINNFQDFQKLGQTGMEGYMKMMGDWNKSWQAIASEMTDYSKRAFEDSTAAFEKLVAAKSVEQAMEIQTTYAKRAYEDYMQQMSKIGAMYQSIADKTGAAPRLILRKIEVRAREPGPFLRRSQSPHLLAAMGAQSCLRIQTGVAERKYYYRLGLVKSQGTCRGPADGLNYQPRWPFEPVRIENRNR